jgi:hypothetical protein
MWYSEGHTKIDSEINKSDQCPLILVNKISSSTITITFADVSSINGWRRFAFQVIGNLPNKLLKMNEFHGRRWT